MEGMEEVHLIMGASWLRPKRYVCDRFPVIVLINSGLIFLVVCPPHNDASLF